MERSGLSGPTCVSEERNRDLQIDDLDILYADICYVWDLSAPVTMIVGPDLEPDLERGSDLI
jgi:hypothetical protein